MKYNYREELKKDIITYLIENYEESEINKENNDKLYDDLWSADSVTGNSSGSYTFCTQLAKEYIMDNEELLYDTLEEYGYDNIKLPIEWENLDVLIRCYLLGEILSEVLEHWRDD